MQGHTASARIAVSCLLTVVHLFDLQLCVNKAPAYLLLPARTFLRPKAYSLNFPCGLCRSFRRAGAAGEELKEGALNKLLEVLSQGDVLVLLDPLTAEALTSKPFQVAGGCLPPAL